MATESPLGTRIKRARERKRWTQQQLADALKVDRKTIDNWENGRSTPRSSIGALEDVLGVSLVEEQPQPLISPQLLADIRRELGDERAARMVAALEEEASAARSGPADGPGQWRRVDLRRQRLVQGVDEKGDVLLPGGHAGAEARPGDPEPGDDDQIAHAGTRQ
jgi:transcriptional regulator with XRE-family HTH domain